MKYIKTSMIYEFYKVLIILQIKAILISCSLSKVASKADWEQSVDVFDEPHSAPCWVIPWCEWGMSKQMKATTTKGS